MVKKIDFHIHTLSSEKDYDFDFSLEWLKSYVSEANLDSIAITNHNFFDMENYLEIKESLKELHCVVYPGMELSLEDGHVNIVFDVLDAQNLLSFSEWIKQNKNNSDSIITVTDYINNMKSWSEGIYIFELGKSNSLNVPQELENVTAVGGVSNQLKFQSIYLKENLLTPVLFSDAHATDKDSEPQRNDIKKLKYKNTFLQIDNCLFQEIKNNISDREKVAVNSDWLRDVMQINGHIVSTGLNLIVGNRGTGKTYFLDEIKKQYSTEDIYHIAQFETSQSEDFIEKHRRKQRLEAYDDWRNKYTTEFEAISNYLGISKIDYNRDVDSYLNSLKIYAQDSAKSRSSSKYLLTKEASFENLPITSLKKYLETLLELISSSDFWNYLKEANKKKKVFIEIYEELRENYVKKKKESTFKIAVNEIIDDVKNISRASTGISKVEDCHFSKIMLKLKTEEAINNFLNKIIKEETIRSENLHGYKIVVRLSPYESATQYQNYHSINEAVKDDLIIPYLNQNYITYLNNLKQKGFYKSSNLAEYLMHLEVDLLDSQGTPASGGQAVGFALIIRLQEAKEKPIILIDEPEASLDNAYIKDDLIKVIRELKKYSTVFVITHNSTLGTLLNPDYLIITKKNGLNDYQVLTGAFKSKIISNHSRKIESYDLFVEAMEAGIQSYKAKGDIYDFLED